MKGKFITLEGCEGSGKSTQLAMLENYFNENGIQYVFTREPGGTQISEKLRSIILDKANGEMTAETEALLYAAARAQLIKQVILPSLENGKYVICDRYIDSSYAYQAYARGLGFDFVSGVNVYAEQNCMPDATIFFDIDPDSAFERKGGADKNDRLEQSGLDFHRKVYAGYKKLCEIYKDRFIVINAKNDADIVHESIIRNLIKREIICPSCR